MAAFLAAVLLVLVQALPVLAATYPEPSDVFYVKDEGDVLLSDTKEYIVATNDELCAKTGAQICVVVVNNMGGDSIEDYANGLFRYYGIGDANKNNGVLFLLALEEREVRIEVGYGLEGAINDGKAGRILDEYVVPYFAANLWNSGIKNGYGAILQEVCKEYGVELTETKEVAPMTYDELKEQSAKTQRTCMIFMGISLVAGLIIGAAAPEGKAWIPGVIYCIGMIIVLSMMVTLGWGILGAFGSCLFCLIGWAITSPGGGVDSARGTSSYSSYSSSSRSSSSSSRSYSSGSSRSGGGGSSGGGGASRKF